MNRRCLSLILLIAVAATQPQLATAGAHSFTPLGNLAGGFSAFNAFDVSVDGSTVVGAGIDANGVENGFRWTTNGELTLFPDAVTYAISGDGQFVIGGRQFSFGERDAYRWSSVGGFQNLRTPPANLALTEGLNASLDGAAVVGYASGRYPFRWTSAGGMTTLGTLPNKLNGQANGISPNGQVVVGQMYTGGQANDVAFRWTASGGMVGLGYLSNRQTQSRANAASHDGSIVVGSSENAAGREAFRWTAATGMVSLGDLPGGPTNSFASDISGDGSIIVGFGTWDDGYDGGVFWDQHNRIFNLKDFLIARGVAGLENWILRSPRAISYNGRTIVGEGINPQGKQEAWVATIPEPHAGVLASIWLGLLAPAARRRRG